MRCSRVGLRSRCWSDPARDRRGVDLHGPVADLVPQVLAVGATGILLVSCGAVGGSLLEA